MTDTHWTLTIPVLPEHPEPSVAIQVPADLEQMTPYVLTEQDDWFESERAFLARLLEPGMTVIDAGACYGVYALTLAKRLQTLGGSARVLALEPAPGPADALQRSIAANHLEDTLILRRVALSDRPGPVTLRLHQTPELTTTEPPGAPASAGLLGTPASAGTNQQAPTEVGDPMPTKVSAPSTTLDAIAQDPTWPPGTRIDILKLDLCGHEPQALQGATQFLRDHDPLILCDAGQARTPQTPMRQLLSHHGYQCYRLLPGLDALAPLDPQRPLDATDINLFACQPSRAARLRAAGRLFDQPLSAITQAPQPPRHWADALAPLPYIRAVQPDANALHAWQTLDRSTDPHWANYQLALNCYLSASDPAQPLPNRAAWLAAWTLSEKYPLALGKADPPAAQLVRVAQNERRVSERRAESACRRDAVNGSIQGG